MAKVTTGDIESRSVVSKHLPVVAPGSASGPPGQLPPIDAVGATSYIVFDQVAGSQAVYRYIKVAT